MSMISDGFSTEQTERSQRSPSPKKRLSNPKQKLLYFLVVAPWRWPPVCTLSFEQK